MSLGGLIKSGVALTAGFSTSALLPGPLWPSILGPRQAPGELGTRRTDENEEAQASFTPFPPLHTHPLLTLATHPTQLQLALRAPGTPPKPTGSAKGPLVNRVAWDLPQRSLGLNSLSPTSAPLGVFRNLPSPGDRRTPGCSVGTGFDPKDIGMSKTGR